MKFKIVSLLVILVLLTILGCQSAAPPASEVPVVEEKVLKVGVMGPFTGPSAAVGEVFQAAVKTAFEDIDYKIGDYQIELIWIDSQSEPEKARLAYEAAVTQDGIQVGLLNWHSSVSVAVMEVTAKYKIPHFFGMGASDLINEKFQSDSAKYNYWNFKLWPMPSQLMANYVTTIEEAIDNGLWDPGEKQAVIYTEDTDWGGSFGLGFREPLESAGWTIVDEQYFLPDQIEFPVLGELDGENVDLIAVSLSYASLTAFLKQADEAGLKSLVVADGLGWAGDWYELTGSASNYVLDQIPGWTTDEAKTFAEEFEARWGVTPSAATVGLPYDATNFFIKIAQATFDEYGELNSETLYKVAQEKVQTGQLTYTDGIVLQEYKYTPETVPDPVVGGDYYTFPILQYMDGQGHIVWPEMWKEVDLAIKP